MLVGRAFQHSVQGGAQGVFRAGRGGEKRAEQGRSRTSVGSRARPVGGQAPLARARAGGFSFAPGGRTPSMKPLPPCTLPPLPPPPPHNFLSSSHLSQPRLPASPAPSPPSSPPCPQRRAQGLPLHPLHPAGQRQAAPHEVLSAPARASSPRGLGALAAAGGRTAGGGGSGEQLCWGAEGAGARAGGGPGAPSGGSGGAARAACGGTALPPGMM